MFPRSGLGLGHMLETETDQKGFRRRITASEAPEEVGRVLGAARLKPNLLELARQFCHGSGVIEASLSVGGENIGGDHP